jgi:hypothetical protein
MNLVWDFCRISVILIMMLRDFMHSYNKPKINFYGLLLSIHYFYNSKNLNERKCLLNKNAVAFTPQENYTDRASAACR